MPAAFWHLTSSPCRPLYGSLEALAWPGGGFQELGLGETQSHTPLDDLASEAMWCNFHHFLAVEVVTGPA